MFEYIVSPESRVSNLFKTLLRPVGHICSGLCQLPPAAAIPAERPYINTDVTSVAFSLHFM